jgi:hypothetical protein
LLSAPPAAVPTRAVSQFAAPVGHVISVLPIAPMSPRTVSTKRGVNGASFA